MSELTTAMQSELVERVARAIAVANHEQADDLDRLHRDSHGELMPVWTNYLPLARAAIEAMPVADEALSAQVAELREALVGVEPYLDAIIDYASSMGEYEPNRIAVNVRQALASHGTDR